MNGLAISAAAVAAAAPLAGAKRNPTALGERTARVPEEKRTSRATRP
jgi:hypothetical protein